MTPDRGVAGEDPAAAGASAGTGTGAIGIGVDIGGTKVLGVAVNAAGTVIAEARAPTPQRVVDLRARAGPDSRPGSEPGPDSHPGPGPGHTPSGYGSGADEVVDAVAAVVAEVRRALEVLHTTPSATDRDSPPPSVGVGAPGMVDRTGVLRYAPNLQAATGADLASLLTPRLAPANVVIENDANCALHAEHTLGAGQGCDDLLLVTLGTGIGGGMITGGRILLGGFGFAGEIGHMLINPSGPPCPCGQRGCWERYASGAGLGMLAREGAYAGRLPAVVALAGGDPEAVRGEHVTQAAADGDRAAAAVLEELGWWVAAGLANLTAVVDPARIVLGGGLMGAQELLLAPTRRAYAELVEGSGRRPEIEIVPAALGERAGAVGAAMAAAAGGLT